MGLGPKLQILDDRVFTCYLLLMSFRTLAWDDRFEKAWQACESHFLTRVWASDAPNCGNRSQPIQKRPHKRTDTLFQADR